MTSGRHSLHPPQDYVVTNEDVQRFGVYCIPLSCYYVDKLPEVLPQGWYTKEEVMYSIQPVPDNYHYQEPIASQSKICVIL